jgi:cell wall-associated NlpC family hydrolase
MPAARGRHAKSKHQARHARPSQGPARLAAVTAAGGIILPIAASAPAHAEGRQAAAVRVSAPDHSVQAGSSAPVGMRLVSQGREVAGERVEVQIPEGNGWRTVARAATAHDGVAQTSIKINRETRVRAYYRGSSSTAPATSSPAVIDVEDFGQQVLAEARRHDGAPYSYGAVGPNAFDSSGFTRYVYGRLGKDLPHNAAAQRSATQPVAQSDVRPGDLVFMDGNGHVGIYAGDGMMWDAPRSGKNVSLRRIYAATFAVGRVA